MIDTCASYVFYIFVLFSLQFVVNKDFYIRIRKLLTSEEFSKREVRNLKKILCPEIFIGSLVN